MASFILLHVEIPSLSGEKNSLSGEIPSYDITYPQPTVDKL